MSDRKIFGKASRKLRKIKREQGKGAYRKKEAQAKRALKRIGLQ